jgi:hypothetical protein
MGRQKTSDSKELKNVVCQALNTLDLDWLTGINERYGDFATDVPGLC